MVKESLATIEEALYHKIESEYAFSLDEETVVVKLRARRGDLQECQVVYKERHAFDSPRNPYVATIMRKAYSDDLFDYFEALLKAPRGIVYYFRLKGRDDGLQYLSEDGISHAIPGDWRRLFCYPYIRKGDLFRVPMWLKHAVVYQIFPDRFRNGDPGNDPPGCVAWDSQPTGTSEHFGGDLAGIIEQIPYLKGLGINVVYLNPIFRSASNHKYDTIDYYDVDPAFGTKESLANLVCRCHNEGIRVILDATFDHCGIGFFAFDDVRRDGPASPYRAWFDVKSFPVEITEQPNYACFGCSHTMPKLMTGNDEVCDYLLKVATYWIRETDIDGWRVDVADEIDRSFLVKLRDAMKRAKSDAVLVGEVWCDPTSWLQGDVFDTVINYGFTWLMEDYLVLGNLTAQALGNRLSRLYASQKSQVQDVLMNLISSHDVPRFLTMCEGDTERFLLAVLLMFTCKGIPLVYYGDEVGMEGGPDPDCRRGMVWEEERQNKRILQYVRKLAALRASEPTLSEGTFEVLGVGDPDVFCFTRRHPCGSIYVLTNRSRSSRSVVLDIPEEKDRCLVDALTGRRYTVQDGKLSVLLAPMAGYVLTQGSGDDIEMVRVPGDL